LVRCDSTLSDLRILPGTPTIAIVRQFTASEQLLRDNIRFGKERNEPLKGLGSIALVALLAMIAGCVTPYQPTGTAGGYYHRVLAENNYIVGFSGNGFTDRSTARDFALLRAAEIGKQLGYDHMVVLGTDDRSRTEDVKFGAPTATTHGTINGNSYSGTTTYNSNEVPVFKPKYEISVLFSEGYPSGRHLEVFRISDVIQTLKNRHGLNPVANRSEPSGSTFDAAISAAVSPARVEFSQKAGWFPNRYGYKGMIQFDPKPTPGALVVTPEAVVFLVQNDSTSQFETAKIIPRRNIDEALVAKLGLSRRLVLVAGNDTNTFELLSNSRMTVDRKSTAKVWELLSNPVMTHNNHDENELNAMLRKLNELHEEGLLTEAE
jgi:hypothetical protein